LKFDLLLLFPSDIGLFEVVIQILQHVRPVESLRECLFVNLAEIDSGKFVNQLSVEYFRAIGTKFTLEAH
jgi:hypothetical protein